MQAAQQKIKINILSETNTYESDEMSNNTRKHYPHRR